MLQVCFPDGTGCAYGTPAIASVIQQSGSNYATYAIGFRSLFFPVYDRIVTLKGDITTTKSTYLEGENDCFHLDFDGYLYPQDSLHYIYATPREMENPVFRTYSKSGIVTKHSAPLVRKVHTLGLPTGANLYYTHDIGFNEEFFSHERLESVSCSNRGVFTYQRCHLIGLVTCNTVYPIQLVVAAVSNEVTRIITGVIYTVQTDFSRGIRYKLIAQGTIGSGLWQTKDDCLRAIILQYRSNLVPIGLYAWSGANRATVVATRTQYPLMESHIWRDIMIRYANTAVQHAIPDMGELSYACLDQMRTWTSNGIALSKDYISFVGELTAMKDLVVNWRSPTSWASAFLSYKYGSRLTVADTKSLIKAIATYKTSCEAVVKVSSSVDWFQDKCHHIVHYGIYTHPYDRVLTELEETLRKFDAYPDYKNLWDLIPFSFVVDWFIDVGNLLDHLDAVSEFSSYDIIASAMSSKTERTVPAGELGLSAFVGDVVCKRYTRTFSSVAIPPSYSFNDLSSKSFDQWIEGTALMVQKIH